jgi:HD superfamily phosphohydrolase
LILKPVAEIRDPVHGYIKLTDVERALIDSPFVQRLRRVHQLAGSYLVYPGAVHSRFEHVVGTMHLAGQVAESLARTSRITKDQIQEARIAALLHDVGHGPFSHTFEEVLAEKSTTTHEDISQRIISKTSLGDVLEKHGYSSKKISSFAVGKQAKLPPFMNEIIAGSLSADMMDYLPRDSYFTGVEYGRVDIQRVIDSLYVVDDRMVIDEAALYAFEALLLARYEMFKAVYFHRTVRAADLMLAHSMSLADSALNLTDLSNLEHYLSLTDEVVLQRITTLRGTSPGLREAKRLALGFRNRTLVKCVFEKLVQRKDAVVEQLFANKKVREQVTDELGSVAGVDPMLIYLDVPTLPSLPNTYSRELLTSVRLLRIVGKKRVPRTLPLTELPLVWSIAGFMDMLRVYTTAENRRAVEEATAKVFMDRRYIADISV